MTIKLGTRLVSRQEIAAGLAGVLSEESTAMFLDFESGDRIVVMSVDEILFSAHSAFQKIDIFRTRSFGLVLTLDEIVQCAEHDEFIYHELLIHPACCLLSTVQSVLVMGGGDGCAARELVKYREIETLEIVDVDDTVVAACRAHFAPVNDGALDNPRVTVIVREAEHYLREAGTRRYDLIVADLTEPYDLAGVAGELSRHIFSQEFYASMKGHLNPGGIFVIQTGGITYSPDIDKHHVAIINGLRKSFAMVQTAYQYIHSFDQVWSITIASDSDLDLSGMDSDTLLKQKGVTDLRYYDTASHRAAFTVPRHLRQLGSQS